MSPLWLVPTGVVVAGAIPVIFTASRLLADVRGLLEELRRWEALRPEMVAAGEEVRGVRARFQKLTRR